MLRLRKRNTDYNSASGEEEGSDNLGDEGTRDEGIQRNLDGLRSYPFEIGDLHVQCLGTQRLSRLVGLSKAIEMMLLSKPVMSEEGKKLGLIDAIVSPEEQRIVSRQWASNIADKRKPWIISLERTEKLGSLSEPHQIVKIAREQAKRIAPNMPQHQACLDVIQEGVVHGGYNGVLKKVKSVQGFSAQRETSKVHLLL